MSVESAKAFYVRVAKDEAFRALVENAASKDECRKIVRAAGYDFTQEEFEATTAQILESEAIDGDLQDLSETELEAVAGGATALIGLPIFQLLYGVVRPYLL